MPGRICIFVLKYFFSKVFEMYFKNFLNGSSIWNRIQIQFQKYFLLDRIRGSKNL